MLFPLLTRVARFVGFLLLIAAPSGAQSTAETGEFRAERITLQSSPVAASASYRLDVFLPPEYDASADSLPVLYYFDAWWWGDLMQSLARMNTLATPPRMSPVILVGVSTHGNADDFNRARNRDFTPSPYRAIAPGVTMKSGNVVLDSVGTGGAIEFMRFLERDVIPTVERRFRTRPAERGIAGHSYAGLFAVWAMANRPSLFSRYLIVSPSTYWNDSEVLRDLDELEPGSSGRRVFLAVGGREMSIMTRSAAELTAVLERQRGIELRNRLYNGADHVSVLPTALIEGLQFLYAR